VLFYTGVDRTNEKQQSFLLWMQWLPCSHQRAESSFQMVLKSNLDVEIAGRHDALVGYYDTAVLVSGDGDLAYAVNAVSYQGVRVEVVGLRSMIVIACSMLLTVTWILI